MVQNKFHVKVDFERLSGKKVLNPNVAFIDKF